MDSNYSDSQPKVPETKPYERIIAGMSLRHWGILSGMGLMGVITIASAIAIPQYVANQAIIGQLKKDMMVRLEERARENGDEVFHRMLENVDSFATAQNYMRIDEEYEKMHANFVHLHATVGLTPPVRKEHFESEKIQPEALYQESIDIVVAASQLENSHAKLLYTKMALDNIDFGKELIPVPASLEEKLEETTQMARNVLEGKTN